MAPITPKRENNLPTNLLSIKNIHRMAPIIFSLSYYN